MPEAASEVLTMEQQANEYIMLQLRMKRTGSVSIQTPVWIALYDQLQQCVHSYKPVNWFIQETSSLSANLH